MKDNRPARERLEAEEIGFFATLGIGSPRRIIIFVASWCLSYGAAYLAYRYAELAPAPAYALFILLFAAALWVTAAIPAFAVGILVIALEIAFLGDPGGVFAHTDQDWEQFVAVLGHPLIWLFFGGFVLAAGMAQTGLDRQLARTVLSRFGDGPPAFLMGVMAITFVLSMFMSNTATMAMILAMLAPILASLGHEDRFARGLLLGTATAANLGGMGSLIGTPPNAIAVGNLSRLEPPILVSFLEWMMLGLPIAIGLLVLTWAAISALYRSSVSRLPLEKLSEGSGSEAVPRWQELVVGGTLFLTVGLWLTGQWHGMPTAVVSFVPIVAFTTTGLLGAHEIRGLNYDVLFLIAGGLALGQAVTSTGLADWIVARLPVQGLGVIGIALLMAYVTLVLSNFMSNTAAANILIPIGLTMAVGAEARVAIPVALAASAAMCLPIATPPNALAFATGRCRTVDFLWVGALVGVIAPAAAVAWTTFVLDWVVRFG